ncbi:MAG: DNA polymerase III subunit beta [Candidatus Nealsonbacteria bacterium CG_4_9_14_3_um_filter_35_11]|uniref:Beta sliding clamp n=2 Tax=Candidatus Nealsoniibacteriota TaxID=1817911 RepID=A0A2M7DAY6_9BACT|nr:MAG: DNA polymerase III subunit beta [Candidatus Nealsonbacteria bacterium CG11_big_fil_rev_8_21_14_0_20_35_11]PIV45635.1 MAG: DNA polymerase III subunit beta [Candidatus Nealsonbacteria bacterium CG02_land_8_20_14_3_00_34_20]PIW92420.1 MAG: DNA polymerase III subunit beta [Candidatus Nealsonbacteria bacterium CG_4_8_14_3_um_filter_34_13]PIZ89951.1 MAG: DNA polymerase III subunit beta [Candidatus Nealsonbacteria bacterium CG_4_10_14_0_2_um_filter_35_20]PJA84411.1 MAG: DNA polymerase III subu
MEIIILSKNFKKGLSLTEKIPGKTLTLPVLNNVLIDTSGNFLKLSATDLEIGIQWWGLCKVEKEGKIAVPVKFLYQLINSFPDEKINIKEKNKTLFIEGQNYKTQIKGVSAEDFPIIPSFLKEKFIEIDNKKIKQGLLDVINMASLSQIRPEISGIYFSFLKNQVKFVATDSFRLAEKTLNFSQNSGYKNILSEEVNFILPQKTARELINILDETQKNIKIYFSESQILFETFSQETDHPEINLISRQIEGEYPSYQDIIPKEYKTKIILNREEFIRQIKVASLFSGKINEVKLKINPKTKIIEIFSQDPDFGESKSNLPAQIEGEKIETSFNWRFILDGLLNMKSSEVSFDLQDNNGPGVLKPIGDPTYLYIVMPIKPT